jgi:hypothetical protein
MAKAVWWLFAIFCLTMSPTLLPSAFRQPLSLAIAHGNTLEVKRLIESNSLDLNAFLDAEFQDTPLLVAVRACGYHPEEEARLGLLRWLLEKGANPSSRVKAGYTGLHVTIQQEKLLAATTLLLKFRPDVNVPDTNGASVLYWAIQGFPWRTTGETRAAFLENLETILLLGGDLDQANRHGMTPRKWLERAPEDVQELVARFEAARRDSPVTRTDQPEFPSTLAHATIAQKIWADLVPASGPPATVQGQLLRAIEKLRDEAHRNGNVNCGKWHTRMAEFVRDILIQSGLFDERQQQAIDAATEKLMQASQPYLSNDLYDLLTDQACVFYLNNPTLLPYVAKEGEI